MLHCCCLLHSGLGVAAAPGLAFAAVSIHHIVPDVLELVELLRRRLLRGLRSRGRGGLDEPAVREQREGRKLGGGGQGHGLGEGSRGRGSGGEIGS